VTGECVGVSGSGLTIELLGESKTTLASIATCLDVLMAAVVHRSSLDQTSEGRKGKENRRLNHDDLVNE
jgi:hypothetical protein